MKILAINGSPKGKNSCTDKILNPLLEGMKNANATITKIYLTEKKIHHCMGCMSCWLKNPGKCVIKDDMTNILDIMTETDLIIYGSPLYCYSVTGLMKNFMDRSLPMSAPIVHSNTDNVTTLASRHNKQIKALLVATGAFPELENFTPVVDSFKKMFAKDYLGEILRPTSELMNVAHFAKKYHNYCKNLTTAGYEIVTDGNISDSIKKELTKPWISAEAFRDHFNKIFAEKTKNI